ncbi:MAG: ferrous iron transport protein B [Oscillospiraceae bacterium]|nr:ferrous iron transport protein B [Oscillospiraceae bacterium]
MTAEKTIALAGNPNVGKSTIFNALTGLHQHTGNWPGKTVSGATGFFKTSKAIYTLVDTPGTYSLSAKSQEEEVTRDYICFGNSDAVLVVLDSTAMARNLNLALQIIETGKSVIILVNMLDEASRRGIKINLNKLSSILGCPVLGVSANKKKSVKKIGEALDNLPAPSPFSLDLPAPVNKALDSLSEALFSETNRRFKSLNLLLEEKAFIDKINPPDIFLKELETQKKLLSEAGFSPKALSEKIAEIRTRKASEIAKETVTYEKTSEDTRSRKLDRVLTGKYTAFPFMLVLFLIILFLTISGANYPSEMLSKLLFSLEVPITSAFKAIGLSEFLIALIVDGAYRTTAWVVSVMLPPMAIFFPLFTLLEDSGYLPRVAYNLDKPFQKCSSCGKQALTMCMGLGCNAAAVNGCRIIDSPRERLLAILTNSFMPCNGRFPIIIAVITLFFAPAFLKGFSTIWQSLLLLLVLGIAVGITFLINKILSKTILKGLSSSFILELPPYRKPRLISVLVRSFLDRTLKILIRAIAVSIPAGIIIKLLANLTIGGRSILFYLTSILNPIGEIMGLDGIILAAFILGLPAAEIILPLTIMIYTEGGSMPMIEDVTLIGNVLRENGWTFLTALNFLLFSLFHWPCATTILTIKKETGSLKWTLASCLIPLSVGFILCAFTNLIF